MKLSRRALEAGRATRPAQSFQGGGATGEDVEIAPVPSHEQSPDIMRALRLRRMLEDQARAVKLVGEAKARTRMLGERDSQHPMLDKAAEQTAEIEPYVAGGLSPSIEAALRRERARTGDLSVDTRRRVGGALESVNRTATSAFQYPLKLVSSLLRPIDSGVPAAVKAGIEGKPALTAAAAAADPLGRFDASGRETGRWTNPATSWHDVTEALLERWGKAPQERFPGATAAGSPGYRHPLTGAEVPATPGRERDAGKELLGMGRPGWAAVGTVADIGLSPSTYLAAGVGAGRGITIAGRTVVPDKAVTAIARAPGSLIEKGAEALAARLALNPRVPMSVAHKVGAVGEKAARYLGPTQALEGAGRVVRDLPLGGGKTLGELAGEAFNRYHHIDQVADPVVRAKLRELASLRESATQAQTAKWTDEIENLFKGLSPEQARTIRDMIESPEAFDWNLPPAREPIGFPGRAITPRGPEGVQPAGAAGWREVRDIPSSASGPVTGEGGRPFTMPRTDGAEGIPPFAAAEEIRVPGRAATSGPSVLPGQPAAPTAVPGTPDAKRYGAIPNSMSGQVPTVDPLQAEIAARVENVLRDVRVQLERRGLVREGGRRNYFPRERTRESLVQQKGVEARTEKLGRGVNPRLDWRAGFQEGRKEHSWINDLIRRVNEYDADQAALLGRPAPAPLSPVEDTTSAINTFWRRLPEELRRKLRGVEPEPERFLDDPKATLQRYLARATKSVNDADTMRAIRGLKGEGGKPLARPFVRERGNGTVLEEYEVPVGGRYDIPKSGPGVVVDRTPAPPGAPQLPRGAMGRKGEAMAAPPRRPVAGELPGEVPPGGAEAFQGKSPFDPTMSRTERPIPGYVYPKNAAWREAFPNTALPRDVAAWVDAFGKPYWANEGFAGLIDQLIVRPLHKLQLPWKVGATSGAGPRFALRNYMSQQVMNLQAYGPKAFSPRIQQESHLLGLPDEIFDANPGLAQRKVTVGGQTYAARELREAAKQTGLWRTMPEAETWSGTGGPFSDVWSGPAHASRVSGWGDMRSKLSAALGRVEAGVQKATKAVGPVNPISKDFILTKGARVPEVGPAKRLGGARAGFHPLAEYGERQGRMAALLLELEAGKPLVEAAQAANEVHVNYQKFSPAFEKYGTLAYPFAKFAVGMTPNQAKWALQYPGRTMFTEHLLRGGEHLVDPEERERFASEPKSQLIQEGGGRLVGYPGVEGGTLKEPEVGRARGKARLPLVLMPPTADTLLNAPGALVRVAASRTPGRALASELLEDALPAFKFPYELATGRNVFTGEPVDLDAAQPAPRAIQVLHASHPELARRLGAAMVVNEKTGQRYLATPQRVNLVLRYFPNIAAADLAAGFLGGKRPYDNQTAIALRLLGVTQILHDPLIPAAQEARETVDTAAKLRDRLKGWTPATR
jgi:hypothetical protein